MSEKKTRRLVHELARDLTLLVALSMLIIAAPGRASAAVAYLEVSPNPVDAGTAIDVRGYDHCGAYQEPDSRVSRVAVGFTPESTIQVDAYSGRFSVTINAPNEAGIYTLTSYCLQYVSRSVIEPTARAQVTVVVPEPSTTVSVTPRTVAPTDEVTIEVRNASTACMNGLFLRMDEKTVNVTWSQPAPALATARLEIPEDTPPGVHQLQAGCDLGEIGSERFGPVRLTVRPRVDPPSPSPTDSPTSTPTRTATPTSTATTARPPVIVSPTGSSPQSPTPTPTATVAPPTTSPAAVPPSGQEGPPPGQEGRPERAALATWLRPPSDSELLDVNHLVVSALLAVVLMLLIGFPAQIFESTLKQNYERVVAPLRRIPRPTWRPPHLPAPVVFGGFVLLATALYGLTDPYFGRDAEQTLIDAVGFLVAIPLITLAFEVPAEMYSRQGGRERARLGTLPAALAIAVACAVLSYAGHFQPGYVYGLIAGYAVLATRPLTTTQQARAVLMGTAAIATVSLLCWVAWDSVDGAFAAGGGGIGRRIVDSILATVVVVGVQALAFQLLPMMFLDGHPLITWSRRWWQVIYAFALFALVFVTFSPRTSNEGVDPQIVSMIALFLAFGVFSVAFWAYFRYRPDPPVSRSTAGRRNSLTLTRPTTARSLEGGHE